MFLEAAKTLLKESTIDSWYQIPDYPYKPKIIQANIIPLHDMYIQDCSTILYLVLIVSKMEENLST